MAWWSPADSIVMAPESSWRGSDAERVLLIPSTHVSIRKRVAWHQRPCAGCVVLALFSLFGLACVSLPSFESPANITVFRASDADVRVRDAAGWREELSDPPSDARHAVTLAVRQDRAAILAALKQVSDPDSPKYGQHLTREEVAELSTPRRSIDFVRAYLDKATNALSVRVSWSPGLDFVRVEGRVEDLDRIFNARFRRWERALRGRVVHATHRTREMAVPKELEAHLDGILGALHLPTGQLQHNQMGPGAGAAGDEGDAAGAGEGPEAADDGELAGLALSAYSERPPIRIDRAPTRRRVNATEWVRRQAEALAAKARVDSSAKSESRARDAEENVEERVEEDIEETAEAPEPAEEEPAAAKLAAAKKDERATSAKVAASESAPSRTNADPAADAPLLGRSPRASDTKTALRKTSGLGGSSPSTSSTGRALLSRRRKAKLGGEASRNAETREDAREFGSEATSAATSAATTLDAGTSSDVSSDVSSEPSPASSKTSKSERKAKRSAAKKAREKQIRSREKAKLEDKANAMFQKFEDEMKEMKTFMAEVVHKDEEDEAAADPDNEDADLSGDGEEKGASGAATGGVQAETASENHAEDIGALVDGTVAGADVDRAASTASILESFHVDGDEPGSAAAIRATRLAVGEARV